MDSLQKRLVSKQWKERVDAYEELTEIFEANESAELVKYAPFLKRLVGDSYPRAQEAGLSALTAFLQRCHKEPPQLVAELKSHLADACTTAIEKCFPARSSTKTKAIAALLLLFETGLVDLALNQLLKACSHKVPKIGAACLYTLREAVRQFGVPTIPGEPIFPVIRICFDHGQQDVRTEAFALTVELHRWMGASLLAVIQDWELRPAQLKELETAFENRSKAAVTDRISVTQPINIAPHHESPPSVEMRQGLSPHNDASSSGDNTYESVKSQMSSSGRLRTRAVGQSEKISNNLRASSNKSESEEEDAEGEINSADCDDYNEELDTLSTSPSSSLSTDHDVVATKRHYDNINPNMPTINLQQILNSEWYNCMKTGTWQLRKEHLDDLISMCDNHRIKPGDYTKLMRALREMLAYNKTVVVASTVKAIGGVAKGLRRDFLPYAKKFVPILLDELKKKSLVGACIHDALDDMHSSCFTLSDMFGEISEALNHKVPRVRSECLKWVKRCISQTRGSSVVDLRPFCEILLKCVDDSQAEVRDLAYSILALLVGFYGETFIQDQLADSDLDRIKLEKLLSTIHPGSIPSTPTKSHTLSGSNATVSPVTNTLSKPYNNTPSPSSASTKDKTPSRSRSKTIGSLTKKGSGTLGSPSPVSTPNPSQTSTPDKNTVDSLYSTTSSPYRTPSRSTKRSSLSLSHFASSNTPQRSGDSHFGQEKPSLITESPAHNNNVSSCNGDSDSFIDFDENLDISIEGDKVFAELTHSDDEPLARTSTTKPNSLGLHDGLSSLRMDLQKRLDQWERQLESAELQCAEYRQIAAEACARNSLLAEQQKQHSATTSELERTIDELKQRLGAEELAAGRYAYRLPSTEQLQSMTLDELNALEQKQEQYLLTIRKIKISFIR